MPTALYALPPATIDLYCQAGGFKRLTKLMATANNATPAAGGTDAPAARPAPATATSVAPVMHEETPVPVPKTVAGADGISDTATPALELVGADDPLLKKSFATLDSACDFLGCSQTVLIAAFHGSSQVTADDGTWYEIVALKIAPSSAAAGTPSANNPVIDDEAADATLMQASDVEGGLLPQLDYIKYGDYTPTKSGYGPAARAYARHRAASAAKRAT